MNDVKEVENPIPEQYKAHWIYTNLCKRNNVQINAAEEAGMIPRRLLVIGATYFGHCRNADHAQWGGAQFTIMRTKFGSTFPEQIPHPENDDGFDVFVPVSRIRTDEILETQGNVRYNSCIDGD